MTKSPKLEHGRLRRALLIPLLLSTLVGCAHQITTAPSSVAPLPEGAPTIALMPDSVSDLGSKPAFTYAHFDAHLRNTLLREGSGQMLWDDRETPLVLSQVNLVSQRPSSNFFIDFSMGMITLVPIFAPIPQWTRTAYSVDYVVDDRAGRQVMAGRFSDLVEGKYSGMYIGRVDAQQKLMVAQGEFLAVEVGRRILTELRSKSELLLQAAARYRESPQLSANEQKGFAHRAQARAARREQLRGDSKKLFSMKQYYGPAPALYVAAGTGQSAAQPASLAASSSGMRRATKRAALGTGGYGAMATPAAATHSARPAVPSSGRLVLLPPRTSMGESSPMQDRILANTMRSALSERGFVLSAAETKPLVAKASLESGSASCESEACWSALRSLARADQVYSLEILREGSGAQLVVTAAGSGGVDSRSKYCSGCDTGKLDATLSEVTTALARASRPDVPAIAVVPAAPAMSAAVPLAQPTSAGATVVNGVVDVAKQCVAKAVAMQACSAIPSFGKTICRAGVQAKFNNLACP